MEANAALRNIVRLRHFGEGYREMLERSGIGNQRRRDTPRPRIWRVWMRKRKIQESFPTRIGFRASDPEATDRQDRIPRHDASKAYVARASHVDL